jgi:hypothetical protein
LAVIPLLYNGSARIGLLALACSPVQLGGPFDFCAFALLSEFLLGSLEIALKSYSSSSAFLWRKQIVEGIDTAEAFILNLSPDSAASDNVLKELNLAEEALEPFILPVMLKEMKIPDEMRYQLAGKQFIAYYLDQKRGVRDLIAEIKKKRGAASERPPIKLPAFREIEIVLENTTRASFDKKAQQKLLETLGEIIKGSIVGVAENFTIVRIEEVTESA